VPDWKRKARVRDPEALERFRIANFGEPCELCELRPGVHVHHRVFRSQGGDDVDSNLQWLCGTCHASAHGIRVVT
jgi:hypothetical protein